ncbi:fungal-specific transcription factor domain-containing protein [Aspergillus karnatakaensis]|uniref:Zn(II)2Cys6 transcription factor n=1 Tax=Aspergillus karnatakaensis TaxID=1810916 RepID=UPI003CCD167A
MVELVWNASVEQQTRPTKSVSYSGCWTCRKRRVKCDERPGTCRACERAKIKCAGYDVRLIWNGDPNTSRRRIHFGHETACPPMTDDEVAKALSTLEGTTDRPATSTTTTIGPFSVFHAQPASHTPSSTSDDLDTGTYPLDQGDSLENYDTSPQSDTASSIPRSYSPHRYYSDSMPQLLGSVGGSDIVFNDIFLDQVHIESPISTSLQESSFQTEHTVENTNNQGTESPHHSSLSSSSSSCDPPELEFTPAETSAAISLPLYPAELSDDINEDHGAEEISSILFEHDLATSMIAETTASMLMQHYMQHVVHLMQPVSHPRNPWKTVYLPLALQGSARRLHSASAAVFHSILSIAAVNLQGTRTGQDALKQLACHHKQRALVSLQSALATKSTPYKDIMAAILSLVSADIMDGGMADHWIHLEAGIKLQASRHYATLVSKETCLLNNICKMLHLFGQTTLSPFVNSKPWPGHDAVPRGADLDSLEASIEFLYGITPSIARAIFKIYRLSQYVAYYRREQVEEEYPESLLSACESLADTLSSYAITSESFSSINAATIGAEEHMLDIARAQAKAFHNASLVYYYRSIQQCSRASLHQEQRAVLDAMNEAEDLKVNTSTAAPPLINTTLTSTGDSSFPAPITWPAFVASCEAVGEHRKEWDTWWRRVQAYGMRSYEQQYAIIKMIWGRLEKDRGHEDQEHSDGELDWREILAELGVRILPV